MYFFFLFFFYISVQTGQYITHTQPRKNGWSPLHKINWWKISNGMDGIVKKNYINWQFTFQSRISQELLQLITYNFSWDTLGMCFTHNNTIQVCISPDDALIVRSINIEIFYWVLIVKHMPSVSHDKFIYNVSSSTIIHQFTTFSLISTIYNFGDLIFTTNKFKWFNWCPKDSLAFLQALFKISQEQLETQKLAFKETASLMFN